ncbi:uncharacterized mitochondrial protein AtMg00860-like [Aristolochia californica]|uniref:uncharacterized mitochondrial protein AtMg00860-like n=1 Tax=Aristolochia californica TaxID=171875 RepID=UPI0035DBDC00
MSWDCEDAGAESCICEECEKKYFNQGTTEWDKEKLARVGERALVDQQVSLFTAGLNEYLRLENYGPVTAPLMSLLKKNSFIWNEGATTSFVALKVALASSPVLQLPNFDELFVVECDASDQQSVYSISQPRFCERHMPLTLHYRNCIRRSRKGQ